MTEVSTEIVPSVTSIPVPAVRAAFPTWSSTYCLEAMMSVSTENPTFDTYFTPPSVTNAPEIAAIALAFV
jgi:hypothetical protein